ncbi:tryptophan 7-halogenase [Streptomyces sannanensis]|uniref:Tryptophan 7-halogenase n=1 Tax=Streptomyces sannanensis TaxID=285536 RepID=A0ABP6SG11_9ACTN
MDSRIKNIVIVGGTAAGWMAAAHLAKAFQGTVTVTLLDTPDRDPGTSMTGEVDAAAPETQRAFFDPLGIHESEWMRACRASFRTAVRYVNWRTEGPAVTAARTLRNDGADHFYRPVEGVLPKIDGFRLPHYWAWRRRTGDTVEPFDYACFREPPLMDARKSPRWLDGRMAVPYAWHVDSRLFTEFLRRFATEQLDVRAVRDAFRYAERDSEGFLTAVGTATGRVITGDFFLDCTGQDGLLITDVLGEPRVATHDRLVCDSAVTVTVPHDDAGRGIEPYTTAVAMPDGWTWKMPLPGRVGAGHVYAAEQTEPEEAARRLCGLWGLDPERTPLRHLRYRTGRSHRSWVKNCVAVGASSYLLEPLEPSGMSGVIHTLTQLVRYFPAPHSRDAPAARFNRAIKTRYDEARDFIQLHYAAGPRRDTPFWQAHRTLAVPAAVHDRTAAHRGGFPFPASDIPHHTVLAALAPAPPAAPAALAHKPDSIRAAAAQFERIKRQQRILLETLPSAHTYLDRLHSR